MKYGAFLCLTGKYKEVQIHGEIDLSKHVERISIAAVDLLLNHC
jgi:hypothetical protein